MRVAAIQMTSTDDVAANLAAARKFVAEAAGLGATLVALPENFAFLRREGAEIPCAQGLDGEIVTTLRELAAEHRIWLLGGSFPEAAGDGRIHNTSVAVDPDGRLAAVYRKIHLFDVDLSAQGGAVYRESERIAPGSEVVSVETPFGGIGLSICYDLRFPELYRALAARGVRFLAVPAAFARETGRDHWEVLLRARAIENQAFVVAAAQVGDHGGGRSSYGRTMIVDPWGLVLARAPDVPGPIVAECRLEEQDRIRAALPALRHRRL
ncbi:MAG TPA: carbon-nitrogen hydrolase family protein [Myxococcota bacterium]